MNWIKDLLTQSRFVGDWYGALTNQMSHTALGAILATVFACIWRAYFGDMPPRLLMIVAVAAPHFVVEFYWQGWDGFDSFVDIAMTSMGAAMVSLPFYQVEVIEGATIIEFVHWNLLYIVFVWLAVLISYVLLRGMAQPRER